MAVTTLVREVLHRASLMLNDDAPQFARYSEREMVFALIDGQDAVCRLLPSACARVDAIKLRAGALQSVAEIAAADCIPGDGTTQTLPVKCAQVFEITRNMGSNGATPGRAIQTVQRDVMNALRPRWTAETGAQVVSVVHNAAQTPTSFYVHPCPPAGTNVWVEMAYAALPNRPDNTGTPASPLYAKDGTSTKTIGLADEFAADFAHYVVAKVLMRAGEEADLQLASTHASIFVNSISQKIRMQTGNNVNLKIMPGVRDFVVSQESA